MTDSILEQATLAHRGGDLKRALELAEEGLAGTAVEVSPKDRYELCVLKSHCLSALGQWQEALDALESAGKVDELDAAAQARLAMHKGYLMGSLARYAECWSLLGQAEQKARELRLPTLVAEILWRRGMMSIFVGDYDSADECLRSALELASAENNQQLQGLTLAGLAKNLVYRGEYAAAIPRFEEALETFEKLESPFHCAIIWSELANCYLNVDEPEKALQFFQKAESVFLESGATPNYQVCLANIGNVYLYLREFLTAISYYQRALELARQLGDQLSISKWLRNLSQAYSQLGNPELAKGFESEAKQVNDHLDAGRQRAKQIAASSKSAANG